MCPFAKNLQVVLDVLPSHTVVVLIISIWAVSSDFLIDPLDASDICSSPLPPRMVRKESRLL